MDTFDTRAYYAAKTAGNGQERYLFAWVASKEYNIRSFNPPAWYGKDYGSWDHGGTMVVHRLCQNPDGTLAVCAPESVMAAFACEQRVRFT
ncbi:MAG: glycoside hydrolase, partial [Firmicutes bacterium]|nr:glycoside hydrolase [Bacillota bacterium]